MSSLAACDRAASPDADPAPAAAPATPPDLSQGPVKAVLSADGRTLSIVAPERTVEEAATEFFYERAEKFDKATILMQGKKDDVYHVLVRVEAPSDPKRDGGRCGDGREVILRHWAFDPDYMSTSSNQDLESCLRRIRVLAQRRGADGGFDFDLQQTESDGSTHPLFLSYEVADYGHESRPRAEAQTEAPAR